MSSNIYNEFEWMKAWREDLSTGVNMMKAAGIDPAHAFDSGAQKYNEQSFSEEGRRRTQRIISWLEDQGVKFEGTSVLDIGAASGVFSTWIKRIQRKRLQFSRGDDSARFSLSCKIKVCTSQKTAPHITLIRKAL